MKITKLLFQNLISKQSKAVNHRIYSERIPRAQGKLSQKVFAVICLFFFLMLVIPNVVVGQNLGINTAGAAPDSSAILDIVSTNKGLLIPRMTTAQRYAIIAPAVGLQVYDINLKGVYYYDGTIWDCLNNPAGTVQYFANTTVPHGYLECNGQSVSTATYPELFAAIGYTYGGSGASFNVPDLRGEFIRGWDHARGIDAGRVMGSVQVDLFKSHNHQPQTSSSLETGAGAYEVAGGNFGGVTNAFDYNGSSPTSSTGGSETRPKNVALMPCIKF